ncbi:uncharacterized protein LOC117127539 [Brassica rapa]|uniref:uncharacterized protein LOC117127539 n=1 Tax=Brassica campestris TaxID=3711 RepID=UPI00142D2B50|nr:uncharacterized protein LOC117127539 [Brassica rapa]
MTKPKAIGGLGFRDFQAWNDAFLGKLGWRLYNNPGLLLSRILKGKYFPSESFMEVTEKSAISHGWRGVLIGRDLLKENLGWVVGDGASIRIWEDPWLSLSTQQRPMGPPTEISANLTVADLFIDNTRDWNEEKIRNLLPQWQTTIKTIVPSVVGIPDKQIWLSTPNGEYTTKSGYHTAIKRRTEELEENEVDELHWFKGVWNLHISPKIKMFLWRLFQKAIPVGETLMARNITSDGRCKRCGTLESIDHLFLHCPYAEKVWRLAPFAVACEVSGWIDLKSVWWILCGKPCLPPIGLASGQLAPWILWQIWCARNHLVFEGKSITEEVCLTKAITSAKEWTSCQDKTPPPSRKTPPRTRPEPNCSVLNTDAAWRATNLTAGLGWTVKTPEGTAEFTKPCRFVGSALIAEGLALREALSGCRDLGLRRIRCESDCAQLIKALNSREAHPELYGILSDVFSISSSFEFISFTWIPRGLNKAADKLAKQCLVGEEVFMTDT